MNPMNTSVSVADVSCIYCPTSWGENGKSFENRPKLLVALVGAWNVFSGSLPHPMNTSLIRLVSFAEATVHRRQKVEAFPGEARLVKAQSVGHEELSLRLLSLNVREW